MLTLAGFLATCGAGACFALGAGHAAPWETIPANVPVSRWPLLAAAFIFLAAAFDMLDGALARVGGLSTRFGAFFDSTIDRCSDAALFVGCAVYFARVGNVTFVFLSMMTLVLALLTSYIKARAECQVEDCSAGYWQRGERIGGLLIATTAGHVPAALFLLATSPAPYRP